MLFSILPKRKAMTVLKWYYISTAIGTVFHEFAHKTFAEDAGLEIKEVDYFSLDGGKLGYVTHEQPKTYKQLFAISVAPFLVNSAFAIFTVGIIAGFITQTPFNEIGYWQWGLILLGGWFGVSVALHSFPSGKDISNIYKASKYLWNERKPKATIWLERRLEHPETPTWSVRSIFTQTKRILLLLTAAPIWLLFSLIHVLLFGIYHTPIIVTTPFVLGLQILNRTKRYGSHFLYTTGLVVLSYTTTAQYAPILYELINNLGL